MNENNNEEIAYIARIVRDIAVTIVAVLLIISMVHYDKYKGLYLGLPITDSYGGFDAKVKIDNNKLYIGVDGNVDANANVRHKNSCVKGYSFGR